MIEQSKIYVNYWLIDRRSKLPLKNKILIWKIILISIWTYGIELCRCLNKDTIAIQLRGQSKILRSMINAPWSISNQTLHDDLGIPFIVNTIQKKSIKRHSKLGTHCNPLVQLPLQQQDFRRLKSFWSIESRQGKRGPFTERS